MTIDPESIRRMIREDREEAERKAADKAERDELRARIDKLESAKAPAPKDDNKDDDHAFEV